VNPI